MEIRPAEPADRERIRETVAASFRSSYSLSPQEIEAILEDGFNDERLTDRLSDPNARVLVVDEGAEAAGGVGGFVDAELEPAPTLRWLHVHPVDRGRGIGTALVERVREAAGGTPLVARVLEDAAEGGEFLERFDLASTGTDHVQYSGVDLAVVRFAAETGDDGSDTTDSAEPAVTVPETVTDDGADRFVDREPAIPGRDAPFFPTYADEKRDDPYGYVCSNCGGTDVTADGLDRLECGTCGNVHLADEWDGAYL